MEKLSYGWTPKLVSDTDCETEDENGHLAIFSPEEQGSIAWIEEDNDGIPCLFIAGKGTDPSFSFIPVKVLEELFRLDANSFMAKMK